MSITGEKLLKIPTYGDWTTHCWITNKSETKSKKKSKYALKQMKMKTQQPKPMGHCKSSAKRKVHCNTGLPQETRKKVK